MTSCVPRRLRNRHAGPLPSVALRPDESGVAKGVPATGSSPPVVQSMVGSAVLPGPLQAVFGSTPRLTCAPGGPPSRSSSMLVVGRFGESPAAEPSSFLPCEPRCDVHIERRYALGALCLHVYSHGMSFSGLVSPFI